MLVNNMSNAKRDENGVATLISALNTDGITIVAVQANPTNHGLSVDDDTTGTDYGTTNALRDENNVSCLMAISSADGVTPVTVYVTSGGHLLIKST